MASRTFPFHWHPFGRSGIGWGRADAVRRGLLRHVGSIYGPCNAMARDRQSALRDPALFEPRSLHKCLPARNPALATSIFCCTCV